ncbi:FkbM family methyltransferase [Xanthobacter sp. V2C-8]|uniref:FkbM family methyltransferase n=1 Tax=Xanthobacter albus TaxID=3119929 RepID=UPI0037280352
MATSGPHAPLVEDVEGRYGIIRFFAKDTVIGAALRLYGEWAENELRFFHHFIPRGGTVLDVGAFIGTHALAFAWMVGREGQVLSFEPQARSFALLEENVRANALDQVQLHHAAVGSAPGHINLEPMNIDDTINFGGLTVHEVQAGGGALEEEKAEVVTIDSLGLARCDFIKLDVEGTEDAALRGAERTITRLRPVIYAECNSLADAARSFAELKSFGYALFLHVVDAFNPASQTGEPHNIFGTSREAGLIGVPPERRAEAAGLTDPSWQLFELNTLDDLAYALLQKPQYFDEVLRTGSAARAGGKAVSAVDYKALEDARAQLSHDLDALRAALQQEVVKTLVVVSEEKSRYQTLLEQEKARFELDRNWLIGEKTRLEHETSHFVQEKIQLEARLSTHRHELEEMQNALTAANSKLGTQRHELEEAQHALTAANSELGTQRHELVEMQSALTAAHSELGTQRQELNDTQNALNAVGNALNRIKKSNVFKALKPIVKAEISLRDKSRRLRRKLRSGQDERRATIDAPVVEEAVAAPAAAEPAKAEHHHGVVAIQPQVLPGGSTAVVPAASTRRLMVCVSHVSPCPPRAGNEYRILRMMRWLRSTGIDVLLVVCPLPEQDLSPVQLSALGAEFQNVVVVGRKGELQYQLSRQDLSDVVTGLKGSRVRDFAPLLQEDEANSSRLLSITRTFCPDVLLEFLTALDSSTQPFAVLVNYCFMTRGFPLLRKDVVKIVDTHDVFSTKASKVVRFGIKDGLALTAAEEGRLLSGADALLAIQPDEALELRNLGVAATVLTVGMDMPEPPRRVSTVEGPVALMVASDNEMNRKGLSDFLRFAWPLVRAAVPDARLHVVGSVGKDLTGHEPNVRWLGHVDDLDAAYAEARLVINPAVAGTGLKIKTLEALSQLRPIVLWPSGVDGVSPELRVYCLCVTDWFQFARSVIHTLADPAAGNRLLDARDTIATLLSQSHVYAEFGEFLKSQH